MGRCELVVLLRTAGKPNKIYKGELLKVVDSMK
jgi:hypothetical protein